MKFAKVRKHNLNSITTVTSSSTVTLDPAMITEDIEKASVATSKVSSASNSSKILKSDRDSVGDRVLTLKKCGHVFHSSCLRTWLYCSTKCPLCNQTLGEIPPALRSLGRSRRSSRSTRRSTLRRIMALGSGSADRHRISHSSNSTLGVERLRSSDMTNVGSSSVNRQFWYLRDDREVELTNPTEATAESERVGRPSTENLSISRALNLDVLRFGTSQSDRNLNPQVAARTAAVRERASSSRTQVCATVPGSIISPPRDSNRVTTTAFSTVGQRNWTMFSSE